MTGYGGMIGRAGNMGLPGEPGRGSLYFIFSQSIHDKGTEMRKFSQTWT